MKTLLISGGTGMIGRALTSHLLDNGYRVKILTRFPERHTDSSQVTYHYWDWTKKEIDANVFDNVEGFIHLAGVNIGQRRWTAAYKAEIAGSRILSLRFIRQFLLENNINLQVFIGASAIGYYGCVTDDMMRKENDPPGNDFLAAVVEEWEKESDMMHAVASRVVILRTGVVFHPREGVFPRLVRPILQGFPFILGSGKQYIDWISIEDIARMYLYALQHPFRGIFNAVSPKPVTYREFVECITGIMNKFCCLPAIPAFLLKFILGERACLITEGVPVSSEKIREQGFRFEQDTLEKLGQYYLKKIRRGAY